MKEKNKYYYYQLQERILDALNEKLPEDRQIKSVDLLKIDEQRKIVVLPCFVLAKNWGKSPIDIAEEIAKMMQGSEEGITNYELRIKNKERGEKKQKAGSLSERHGAAVFEAVKNEGPYLNFVLNKEELAKNVLGEIQMAGAQYGSLKNNKEKVIIEYVSPNTNKPLHLGHLRNALLGNSLSNLLKNSGKDVKSMILYNDRGVHICKAMLAYKKWGNGSEPAKKSDHFVGDYYVKFAQEVKKNEKLDAEAQEMLERWESGDAAVMALWEKMRQWTLDGFKESFAEIGISFDKEYFESDLYERGREIIEKGVKQKKFVRKEDSAIAVNLDKYQLPEKVLQRSNGTSLYIAQDLALAEQKMKDFQPDQSIYVVGNEQDLYFQQLFAVLDILGFKHSNCHLSYGMVNLPEGKMKSREGTVVDADDLIGGLTEMARKEVKKRDSSISKEEVENRAEKIALAAIKFYILLVSPASEMIFDPKKSIEFRGKTGPYLLYTYARINSILKKSGIKLSKKVDFAQLNEFGHINFVLGRFPLICSDAEIERNPSIVAKYLYDLADEVNKFYHSESVIKSEDKKKKALVLALSSVNIVLKKGLQLLGIEVLEQM